LHFNRVDSYKDFPTADRHDGEQLPIDRERNAETCRSSCGIISMSGPIQGVSRFPCIDRVIADPETDWRTVVANRRGRSLNPQSARRLAAIEKKLEAEYTLSAD
jgi:hypothetical protein